MVSHETAHHARVGKPPDEPWAQLEAAAPTIGCLSFYYSDEVSPLPVRAITRPHDNKSDPNIETGTYGLFSTCQRAMRAGVVNRGVKYVFFVCRRDGRRVVSGYYRIGWFADGILHAQRADFALAAERVHFVNPPIPLSALPEPVATSAARPFRLFKFIGAEDTSAMIDTLDVRPNALQAYLDEVDRLERLQLFHSGYRYVSWQQIDPFSWDMATPYLRAEGGSANDGTMANTSPTGYWQCANCAKYVANMALLKRCPFCRTMGTLRPVKITE